jgi:hypothetical protein
MALRLPLVLVLALVAPSLGAQLAERPLFIEARVPKSPTVASGSRGDFLVYELHVTNFEPRPLTLTRVEVLDTAGGATLVSLADSALWRDLARPGAQPTLGERSRIGPGERAVAYLFVELAGRPAPAVLRHRLTMTDSAGARTIETREVPVANAAAIVGPPLKGGPWLAANGPASLSGHRRALIPIDAMPAIAQRLAIDYVMVDTSGSTFRGDRLTNASYHAHGQEAIAVADGMVVATKDSIPENVPGPTSRAVPITLVTVGGNHVILDVGNGRYAFYAHLQPGSLRVKVGDRVRRGQTLGLVGNSGNSTEPHLHFHIADRVSPLGAEGIPYVHERLEYVGRCTGMLSNCVAMTPETKRRVMPLGNEVVRFPR